MTDPRRDPEETLDALEERVFGQRRDQRREEPDGPAFEQDIDPEETTAEHGGHPAGESPA
ncbi:MULTISPECIES: hypothetical protein [Actinokineospora]|uniref:Uncharacterized protein n=1 Tax=Actinokineospora fastidiosa TaxID=1816 RepID=A0A918GGU0_9PSEU|nr:MULTISPECIES: hypothetical protein [Actinokineospora]UVS80343.1 hypothetical protein Actkin_04093 [Actinokineospora sp. UTMC 2448]GGS34612.1 hypothetical protein GCM10010171_31340 [Actinokineospora fastidiosa]